MRESTLGMGSPEAGQGWEKEERDEVTLGMDIMYLFPDFIMKEFH